MHGFQTALLAPRSKEFFRGLSLSIEEGWIEKFSGNGKKSQGRSDLWLRLCPPTSENDYLIEAKIEQYLNLDLAEASAKITEQIKVASENAQSLKGRPEKIAAMVFLSLRCEDSNLDLLEQKTNDVISHIWNRSQSQKDIDAIGAIWMGAKDFQRSKYEREQNYPGWGNVHFGMVLLASRIEIFE